MTISAMYTSGTAQSVRGFEPPAPRVVGRSEFLSQLKAAGTAPQDQNAVSLSSQNNE